MNSEFMAVKKIKVSLDVDYTIANIIEPMLELHNKVNQTNFNEEDINSWSWSESLGISEENANKLYVNAWIDMSNKINFMADTKLLLELEKYYDIEIVTNRGNHLENEKTVEPLKRWLKKHGLGGFKLIINDVDRDKSTLDYDIYIDDSPALAESISKMKNKTLFLINATYNRHVKDSENIIRVADVNESLSRLINIANSKSALKYE